MHQVLYEYFIENVYSISKAKNILAVAVSSKELCSLQNQSKDNFNLAQ